MYVRSSNSSSTKVWLCLYTCSSTRAVHLDLVTDMTAITFLRSFRRFTARRGIPSLMISDNGKTFKSASRAIKHLLLDPIVKKHFSNLQVEWRFNLAKAPWWGGIFERMIRSAKRCLRKAVGKNCLSYDELLTLVTEVEAVLNSRPLTYISSEEVEEPLTPSHLMLGFRVMSLPDPSSLHDPDFNESGSECLTQRRAHVCRVLKNFWRRWKREYLTELREFHRTKTQGGSKYTLQVGEIVTIYDENHPRGMWRLGRVEDLIKGVDGVVRGVSVRTLSSKGQVRTLHRPVQHIYPLEVRSCQDQQDSDPNSQSDERFDTQLSASRDERISEATRRTPSKRTAALNARLLSQAVIDDESDSD